MSRRWKDKAAGVLRALGIGAVGPILFVLAVRFHASSELGGLSVIAAIFTVGFMLWEIVRILSGAELPMWIFLIPLPPGITTLMTLLKGNTRAARWFGLFTLVLAAIMILEAKKRSSDYVRTIRTEEAQAESDRLDRENEIALEQEETVFTGWERDGESWTEQQKEAGNEKE